MHIAQPRQKLQLEVSDDRLHAWIRPCDPERPFTVSENEIVRLLDEANVVVDKCVRERIGEYLALAESGDERRVRFLVAMGCAAVDGTNGAFHLHDRLKELEREWQGDAPVNYYTYESIHIVGKDDVIGIFTPLRSGRNGVDVFGKILEAVQPSTEVELDASVGRAADDPSIVIAKAPGHINFDGATLSIGKVLTIADDAALKAGPVESPIDVYIPGTVPDESCVRSGGTIVVAGAIEAAEVEAGGDLIVRGGIPQKGSGSLKAGRDIVAKFCDKANLRAVGDVKVCNELMNSHVHCDGRLLAAHGAIVGGSVYARQGIEAATLGNSALVRTNLAVGLHPHLAHEIERQYESIRLKKKQVDHNRTIAQPMMADMKRLSAKQREYATELIYEAEAIDAEIAEIESRCATMLENEGPRGVPYVLASGMIFSGVKLSIGSRTTTFKNEMPGPIRIEVRKVRNVTELVAINQLNDNITILQSRAVDPDLTRPPVTKP